MLFWNWSTEPMSAAEDWFDRTPRRMPETPPPDDPALPNLRSVWQLGPILERSVGVSGIETRPRYIKYKPNNKAILLHDVRLEGTWTCAKVTVAARKDLKRASRNPDTQALAQRVRTDWHLPEPIVYLDDVGALLEWYPANLDMPGLSAPLSELLGPLVKAGATIPDNEKPRLVNYRPERRGVLRWGDVYLKTYALQEHYDRASLALEFSSGLPGIVAPDLMGNFPEHRLSAQKSLLGSLPSRDPGTRSKMGEALLRLHESSGPGLPNISPARHLTAAKNTGELVVNLRPGLASKVERLVSALEARLPRDEVPVVSHGDFHRRQMIVVNERLAMLDFDSMCLAHPAYDPAKFAASQVNGKSRNLDDAFQALDDLLAGYGRRPPDLEWHVATHILRRASKPFRYFRPNWPQRIDEMIAAAGSLMD
jgi:hypothetical protein